MMMDGGYMEQEEEWEREGLLDPAWEKQQRKVINHMPVYFIFLIVFYVYSTISVTVSSFTQFLFFSLFEKDFCFCICFCMEKSKPNASQSPVCFGRLPFKVILKNEIVSLH